MKLKNIYKEVKLVKNITLTPAGKEVLDNYDKFRELANLYHFSDIIDREAEDIGYEFFDMDEDWNEYPYQLGEFLRNYLNKYKNFTKEWLIKFAKEWGNIGVGENTDDEILLIEKLKPYIKF